MYVIQVNFRGNGLNLRYANLILATSEKDIVNRVNSRKKNIECEVFTNQPRDIQDDMIAHWARKGSSEGEELQALKDCVYNNNYVLLFPVFKLCRIKSDGSFDKFHEATVINESVYILEEANSRGEFTKLTHL